MAVRLVPGGGYVQDAGSVRLIPGAGYYQEAASSSGQTLTAGLFSNASTFYAATVAPGAVALQPARLDNAQSFFAPTVTLAGGPQNLTAGLFSNSQTFYAATVSPGAVTISPGLFENAQTFYAANVYDPATVVPSAIRFDIATGRLVKIINGAVALTL